MKTIADLTIKQLQKLSGKKFQSKKKFFEWFDKDPLERLSLSSSKNLAKKKKIPFSRKNKAELVSLLKGKPLLQLKFISSSKLKRFNAFFDHMRIVKTTFQDGSKLFQELAERIRQRNKLGKEDLFRIFVSHPSWRRPCSTKQAKFSEELKFFEDIARWVEYKDVPLEELEMEVQSFLIPKGKGRLKATKDNLSRKKTVICIKTRIPCALPEPSTQRFPF